MSGPDAFDVLIVGGGLAGASLAVALQDSRLRVAVIDAQSPSAPPGWDARVYAVSPINKAFLQRLGIWARLDRTRIAPVRAMHVAGDAGGQLHFSAYEAGLGELAWILESGLMQRELWETLRRQHNVTLFCPTRPEHLEVALDAARVTLTDGRVLSARLVVGADGRDSWVRAQAGIEASARGYDEHAVVANFRCEHDHHDVAFQWFRDDGILAWLPLPDRYMSMVWSAADEVASALMQLDEAAFCARVETAGGRRLGSLTQVTPPAAFSLRLMRVTRTVAPRLALVGDAAHAIHPLSGHGINLGFQDVAALADLLRELPAWRDPGELPLLRRFERCRAEEPLVLQTVTDLLNRMFRPRDPLSAAFRNLGMDVVNRAPFVRNALIRYATLGHF